MSNVLHIVPTCTMCIRTAIGGYRIFLGLLRNEYPKNNEDGIILFLSATIVGMLGALSVLCALADTGSDIEWARRTVWSIERPFLKDVVSLALVVLYMMEIDFDGGGVAAVYIWSMSCIATCFYAAMATTILSAQARAGALTFGQILESAKVNQAMVFGLRYGLVGGVAGILPMVDAAVFWSGLAEKLPWIARWNLVLKEEDSIQSLVKPSALPWYLMLRIALWVRDWNQSHALPMNVMGALVLLPVINCVVVTLVNLGITLGTLIAERAQAQLQPNARGGIRVCPCEIGCLCTIVWVSLLVGIVFSLPT